MAGNTRGKLKEEFEGIHRNFDWITVHCGRSLNLIKEHKPNLSESIQALDKGCKALDKLSQAIYAQL